MPTGEATLVTLVTSLFVLSVFLSLERGERRREGFSQSMLDCLAYGMLYVCSPIRCRNGGMGIISIRFVEAERQQRRFDSIRALFSDLMGMRKINELLNMTRHGRRYRTNVFYFLKVLFQKKKKKKKNIVRAVAK